MIEIDFTDRQTLNIFTHWLDANLEYAKKCRDKDHLYASAMGNFLSQFYKKGERIGANIAYREIMPDLILILRDALIENAGKPWTHIEFLPTYNDARPAVQFHRKPKTFSLFQWQEPSGVN